MRVAHALRCAQPAAVLPDEPLPEIDLEHGAALRAEIEHSKAAVVAGHDLVVLCARDECQAGNPDLLVHAHEIQRRRLCLEHLGAQPDQSHFACVSLALGLCLRVACVQM